MSTINKPDRTLVSLFAGCGGSSLGYKQAGFDIKLAVEWDTKAADVYKRNFDGTQMFVGDIADLTAEEALEITGLQPGELDVLDGSPPCQGFSTAGRRKFEDSRNRLFEEYVRMIDVFKPKMLVMENVSGLRKGKMKLMFAEMTIALKQAGYRVSCRELNAWWYGVPQDRRRLIWVGVREDLDMEPGHPAPTVMRAVSVREALGILYDADVQGINAKMRNPDFENKWKDGEGVGPTLMSSRPPTISIDTNRYKKDNDKKSVDGVAGSFRAVQKPRLVQEGIQVNYTFPCNADRDGKPMEQPVGTMAAIRPPSVTDGTSVRYLTIEESKILQGFPESFQLKENEYKFVGNSVCPPMAEALGRHLLRLLGE
jgi:DNA-cytosine methyltransferase